VSFLSAWVLDSAVLISPNYVLPTHVGIATIMLLTDYNIILINENLENAGNVKRQVAQVQQANINALQLAKAVELMNVLQGTADSHSRLAPHC